MADEPFPAFVVGHVRQRAQTLEVGLARRAGREQHQDRRGFVRRVAETMDPAGWDVEEVALVAVGPLGAVVELRRSRQDEERLGHGAVIVRRWPTTGRGDVDPVEAIVAAGGLLIGQVVLRGPEGLVVGRRPPRFQELA